VLGSTGGPSDPAGRSWLAVDDQVDAIIDPAAIGLGLEVLVQVIMEREALDGILGGGGGVAAAGWNAPDQDARFRLGELPPFGLLTPMVTTT
jgi:hypothetical protein